MTIGPRTLSSEMNETSIDREVDRLRQGCGRQRPAVGPLHADDAAVAAEHLGKLSTAHVESVDAACAALQQDIGEATGRRADVERDLTGRVDPERFERGGQLEAAAADVRHRLLDDDGDGVVDLVAGLAIPAGGVAIPDADLAGQDERLGARPRIRQPAIDQQLVEADLGHAGSRGTGHARYRGTGRSTTTHPHGPGAGLLAGVALAGTGRHDLGGLPRRRPGEEQRIVAASRDREADHARDDEGHVHQPRDLLDHDH